MAEQSKEPKLVPARYTGPHVALLAKGQGPFFNVDGTRRTKLTVEQGDELMMPAREILGYTLLHDPHMVSDPLDLGVGKRVLPEHRDLSDAELAALGYEFHLGRSDFEALTIVEGSIEKPAPVDTPSSDPLAVLSHLTNGGQS